MVAATHLRHTTPAMRYPVRASRRPPDLESLGLFVALPALWCHLVAAQILERGGPMSSSNQFVQQIRQARLFRVLAVYAGASWVILEAVGLFVEQIALPDWVFPRVPVMPLVGFTVPVATALGSLGRGRWSPGSRNFCRALEHRRSYETLGRT